MNLTNVFSFVKLVVYERGLFSQRGRDLSDERVCF
jgi:hypothetical protein